MVKLVPMHPWFVGAIVMEMLVDVWDPLALMSVSPITIVSVPTTVVSVPTTVISVPMTIVSASPLAPTAPTTPTTSPTSMADDGGTMGYGTMDEDGTMTADYAGGGSSDEGEYENSNLDRDS